MLEETVSAFFAVSWKKGQYLLEQQENLPLLSISSASMVLRLCPDLKFTVTSMTSKTVTFITVSPLVMSKVIMLWCWWDTGKQTELKGNHAMVLVGHRKHFFLLQNWWRKKQFVELDGEYLVASGASITFIKTPQNGIPTSFAISHGKYFELEMIDKPEGIIGEMLI
eukprot:TRINITY_DN3571_c0_g2_i6.p1 TRINITY_DN3571_c0_g2~~TRINITY_DN3571_c0_g2_i6.p1  ORF type:complete len:167 (-),score=24.75 TRINITY_DN3571_c0_g2_i6:59-559(-)